MLNALHIFFLFSAFFVTVIATVAIYRLFASEDDNEIDSQNSNIRLVGLHSHD